MSTPTIGSARSRPRRAIAWCLALVLAAAVLSAAAAPQPANAVPPPTTVSLTFDDGDADQMSALPVLRKHGMKGTFFVPSGYVGAAGYMTRADLNTMKAAGHEIGGHTVNHPDLASLPVDEAMRQICTDRKTLTAWGFSIRSFSYPFASSTPAVEQAAADCGYRSARLLGDLHSRFGCEQCAVTESLPPVAPFATKALAQFDSRWTLADLKQGVLDAETTGGWVQYTFHNVCAKGCGELAISPALLDQFLAWLKPRAVSNNTVVKTVGDAVGGAAHPVADGPSVPPAAAGVNGIKNPGFETLVSSAPSCWMQGGWGTNTATFSTGTPTRTGARASVVTVTDHSSGDAKLLPQFDLGACAPTVVPGRTYSLRSWYTSTRVTQFAVYLRNAEGGWIYWVSSPWFEAASTYTRAEWTTPVIPAGYSGISFALNIFGNGTLRTDNVALREVVGTSEPRRARSEIPVPVPVPGPVPVRPIEVAKIKGA